MQLRLRTFPEAAKVPFQRTSMERIRRKLRNVKVQQLAKRAHMAIGVQQPNPLAPRSESSC